MKHSLSEVKAHNERRRKLLKDEDLDGYDWEIFNQRNRNELTYRLIQANFNQTMKCPKRVFMQTQEKVNNDKELRKRYKETIRAVEEKVR